MSKQRKIGRRQFMGLAAAGGISVLASPERAPAMPVSEAVEGGAKGPRGWWPQPYSVEQDEGTLRLSTRYYTVEHDLKQGGTLSKISYTHGRVKNLLLRPFRSAVRLRLDEKPGEVTEEQLRREVFTDVADSSPSVATSKSGSWEVVNVESRLLNGEGKDSGITTRTSYTYRWGYIKIHKEFRFSSEGVQIRSLSAISIVLDPSLTHYGYRPNPVEVFPPSGFGAPHSFWGEIHAGAQFDARFETRYVPCYLAWSNPGIEGLEWFSTDDLAQWNYQMTGQPGAGHCLIQPGVNPPGIEVSIDPLTLSSAYNLDRGGYCTVAGSYAFDYYLGMPILEGHAHKPWFERSYGANRGEWVSEDEIKRNAKLGVVTMTLHNDGDANHDGLYWHDGSWPPYPPEQMKRMAEVIENCHKYGIKTVPYFSNEELNQVTEAFKKHGEEWGCKPDDQGNLRPNTNYGALMCLKSGWLNYLEFCVDRVLKHYPFDGVYYDWNQPLYCNNPLHAGKTTNGVSGEKGLGAYALSPTGHWAIDEYLQLMEWTRERVGPDGLVLIHNSNSPMMAMENFANAVCTMEWGYGKLSTGMPAPAKLPLEWNFVGARSRAVIEYGSIAKSAPARIHQLFYLTAMITGVATWPASDGTLEVFKLLRPLGDFNHFQFEDWRNAAVRLGGSQCYSAVYSRAEEAYIVVANLASRPARLNCSIDLSALPHPFASAGSASLTSLGRTRPLHPAALTGPGEKITVPATSAVLLRIATAR